ncbi:T6SS immunity protein Tli3 family protein [Caballeronia sordidicola]|uniref:T6SS immunity protein Tli3 family protein n=1 Tax=Caballeronia sordidicola TaxID=196367 RepID=UPI003AF3265D
MPVGVPSNFGAHGPSIDSFPEHFAYRIDDHRYITTQGNDRCQGMLYYYDTQAGVRTAVGPTGQIDRGTFSGYYAAQSQYVAIPSIGYSEISGPLLYIYYSYDRGNTFKRFLAGSYAGNFDMIILDGKKLYVVRNSGDPTKGIYVAYLYDVSHEITTGDNQQAIRSESPSVTPSQVPIRTTSPSGKTKWACEATAHD